MRNSNDFSKVKITHLGERQKLLSAYSARAADKCYRHTFSNLLTALINPTEDNQASF